MVFFDFFRTMSPWVVLIVVALSVEALAGPEVQVPQADAVPLLDGKADEGFWADAAVLDGFTLFDPNTTGVKKFDAEAKVVVGAEALYFFVDVRLGSDAVIYAPFSERDRIRGDQLQIHIDPFAEGRRGYGFRVNARGVLGDMLINATGSQDDSWDSLFDASTTIRDDGWSAELAIPFRSLRFDPRQEKWSAHVYVESWDHQQSISWAPIDRNERNWLTLAGTLEGLEGREPGRAIEVLPSVTLRSEESEENPLPGCKFEASAGSVGMCGVEGTYGVGLKWGITPSLTLDGVFNPDYSQIEADANQLSVNNRFALYLPERRPFFLEGADIFSMRVPVRSSRALGRTVIPFYSRSVGRPDFAMKLTGQQGSVRVGAFFATDPESPGSTNDDFTMHAADPEDPELEHVYESRRVLTTVARAQVDVSRKATVGAVLVERDWLGDGQRVANNLVFGADGQAYLSKALNLETAWFGSVASDLNAKELSGYAGQTRLSWKTEDYRIFFYQQSISEDFRSEAGFLTRHGFHRIMAKTDLYFNADLPWAREVSPGLWVDYYLDESGQVVDKILAANNYWRFGERMYVFGKYEHYGERLEGGEWLGGGDSVRLSFGSSTWQAVQFGFAMQLGEVIIRDEDLIVMANQSKPFWGFSYSPAFELTVRPSSKLWVELSYDHSFLLDGADGEQLSSEPIARLQGRYFFNRDWNIRVIEDWDGYEQTLSSSVLLSYTPMPGTVFYAGYAQSQRLDDEGGVSERSVFLKGSVLLGY